MSDFFDQSLDLDVALALMNERVGQIMQRIYAEEAKDTPDEALLQRLRESHASVEKDRRAMRGNKPITVRAMIEKYKLLLKEDPTYYE